MHAKIILLLLLWVFLATGTDINDVSILPFKNNPGIYFENQGIVRLFNNKWKIIIYYDLLPYKFELKHIQAYITEMGRLCTELTKIPNQGPNNCASLISELQVNWGEIAQRDAVIFNNNKIRTSRSVADGLGSIAKMLIGTLDEDDVVYYNNEIAKLKKDEDHLLTLIKNQTSIIESTSNIFRKTNTDISNQFATIDEKLKLIGNLQNSVDDGKQLGKIERLLSDILIHTTLLMTRYQNIQNSLIETPRDMNHGNPQPTKVTTTELRRQLQIIRYNIPDGLALPITNLDEELLQIYQIATTKARLLPDKIIIELSFPLLNKESYILYT